jgi:hypothetical protein
VYESEVTSEIETICMSGADIITNHLKEIFKLTHVYLKIVTVSLLAGI